MSDVAHKQEELQRLRKALTEAHDSGKKTAIQEVLTQLYSIRVDEKLLRAVGKLRNNEDAEIATQAKRLVHKWKKDVMAANAKGGSNSANGSTNGSANGSANGTAANSGASAEQPPPAMRRASSTAGARTVASDGITIPAPEMLYNAMAVDSNADGELIAKRAAAIERIEYAKESGATPNYKARIRSLVLNLKDKKNPALRMRVVDGNIYARAAVLDVQGGDGVRRSEGADGEIKEENLFKAQGAGQTEAETDQFRCGRCKSRKCTYYQMQTRSADEPMTTFVTCTNCNNRWKFC
ncbi:transcription elongation factor [Linderina pennispora]|uniref:Transcription elongation factor n=1 Tax=Linderina pennispora TaxID=61395 RepID=A0A1Y1VZ06_9FUNG|nr:transcription elongation factor [Linderina pennispora]ORX66255.1 transcription elongation factor [Linderina pennispora]